MDQHHGTEISDAEAADNPVFHGKERLQAAAARRDDQRRCQHHARVIGLDQQQHTARKAGQGCKTEARLCRWILARTPGMKRQQRHEKRDADVLPLAEGVAGKDHQHRAEGGSQRKERDRFGKTGTLDDETCKRQPNEGGKIGPRPNQDFRSDAQQSGGRYGRQVEPRAERRIDLDQIDVKPLSRQQPLAQRDGPAGVGNDAPSGLPGDGHRQNSHREDERPKPFSPAVDEAASQCGADLDRAHPEPPCKPRQAPANTQWRSTT